MSITSNKAWHQWHQSQTFSRDCAIEYTAEMSWRDSYKMLDKIHYGRWKYSKMDNEKLLLSVGIYNAYYWHELNTVPYNLTKIVTEHLMKMYPIGYS